MNAKPIVSKLRALAADPSNRATIVRDQGCLPGLILFLDNDDPDVISIALEALSFLSECSVNKPLMRSEYGLGESLDHIAQSSNSRHIELAKKIQKNISSTDKDEESNSLPTSAKTARVNKTARNYVFHICGTKQPKTASNGDTSSPMVIVRQRIEDTLLDIKGVVSFTFEAIESENKENDNDENGANGVAQRLTVRCKPELPLDRVTTTLATIASHQIRIFQVARHPKTGQEKLVDLDEMMRQQQNNANSDAPKYLDEDEDYLHQQQQQQQEKSEKRGLTLFPRKWGTWFGKKEPASTTTTSDNANNGWFGGFMNKVFSG